MLRILECFRLWHDCGAKAAVLAFNEFGFGTVVLKPAPWGLVPKGEWTDHEDRLAAEWLQRQGILVSAEVAGQAVQTPRGIIRCTL
jgi:hypothetical protein